MRDSLVQNFHRNDRGAVETGAPYVDKDFASLIKEAAEVTPSSFEFYVWSDKGISLHVDLNSSPSDWTNRFRNEVQASETMYGNKSRSLRQDLACLGGSSRQERLSLRDANFAQIDAHNGLAKSSPSLKFTKDSVVELDQRNKIESPLILDSLTPCSMNVEAEANLKEVGMIVGGRENSECSEFDDRVKKSGLDHDDQGSKMKLCKKRKRDFEILGSSSTPVTRILRSMKNTVARILPRRSMRLKS